MQIQNFLQLNEILWFLIKLYFDKAFNNKITKVLLSKNNRPNLITRRQFPLFVHVFSLYDQYLTFFLTTYCRSSRLEVFLKKGVLKICSKFTGEHPCRNFIEITLRHGCSPVNLLHIFRTPFFKNISGWLLLILIDVL